MFSGIDKRSEEDDYEEKKEDEDEEDKGGINHYLPPHVHGKKPTVNSICVL